MAGLIFLKKIYLLFLDDWSNIKYMKYNDTKHRIIEIGTAIILAKGYHAVGLQEILKEAGVPKGSFYHYFKSKEDFGIALVESYGKQSFEMTSQLLESQHLSPKQKLKTIFIYWREYHIQHCCNATCLVGRLGTEMASASEPIRAAVKKQADRWVDVLAALIVASQSQGEFSLVGEPHVLAEFIYAAWQGSLTRMQINKDIGPLDLFLEQVFDHILV